MTYLLMGQYAFARSVSTSLHTICLIILLAIVLDPALIDCHITSSMIEV